MKRKLSLIAAGLVLAGTAQADPGNYLSVGMGESTWNEDCTGLTQCDRSGTVVRILGGHGFVKGRFAVEGLYLDLGRIKGSGAGVAVEIKAYALGVGGALFADFAPNWRGAARLGLAGVKAEGTGTGLGVSVSDSKNSAQPFYGLSLAYAITPALYLEASVDGTRVKLAGETENVSTVALGLGWRF